MNKNKGQETNESGKMMALTLCLTNFLLLAVVVGVFWLVHLVLTENNRISELAHGIAFR